MNLLMNLLMRKILKHLLPDPAEGRVFSKQSLHYVDSVLHYTTDNHVKYMSDIAKQEEFSFNVITRPPSR